MEKQKFIQTVLEYNGIEVDSISNKNIYEIIENKGYFKDCVKIYDKKVIISKLLQVIRANDDAVTWYVDMGEVFKKLDEENGCKNNSGWKFTHQSTGEAYTFCPNCGCKLPGSGCGCKEWVPVREPLKLIRNIHVNSNIVNYTHSNDNDIVSIRPIDHDEKYIRSQLSCMNLSNELQLYNSELIQEGCSETVFHDGRKVHVNSQRTFWTHLGVLLDMGYVMPKQGPVFYDCEIIELKKEKNKGHCY